MRRFSFLATCLLAVLTSALTLAQTTTTTPPTQSNTVQLTKKQNKKIGKALGKLDQDHDGRISRAEWNRNLKPSTELILTTTAISRAKSSRLSANNTASINRGRG